MSNADVRSMILAVVQEKDLDPSIRALEPLGAPAVYMSSTGGFLGRRNATRSTCRQRVEFMTMPVEGAPMPMPAPIPVTVGGATVFALPVDRFEEF